MSLSLQYTHEPPLGAVYAPGAYVCCGIGLNTAMNFEILHPHAASIFSELIRDPSLNRYLGYLHQHHIETYEHSLRVAQLCLDLGCESGLSDEDLVHLGSAGLLHDIGKVELPRDLLSKPEALDRPERYRIRTHVRLGFLKLADTGPIQEIIVGHHEYSLNPYPRNGEDRRSRPRPNQDRRQVKPKILRLSMILALADMVDALIHTRPYKEGYSPEATAQMLAHEFTGDPWLVRQVLRRLKMDMENP